MGGAEFVDVRRRFGCMCFFLVDSVRSMKKKVQQSVDVDERFMFVLWVAFVCVCRGSSNRKSLCHTRGHARLSS